MAWSGQRWREGLLVLALTAVALLVRAFELGATSLWIDEAFSAWVTTHGMAEIWRVIPRFDTHPPLYYALLDVWASLFGDGEAALRSLSVAFAAVTVPVIYLAGRALAPAPADAPWLGALAAALFALAPFQVAYAQEARGYAALVAAAAVALLGAQRLLREPALANVPWLGWGLAGTGPARVAWALLVTGWALCLWLHNLGTLVLAALLPPLCWWWLVRGRGRIVAANLALAMALAILVWLPNLPAALGQVGDVAKGFWLAPPSWPIVARTLRKLLTLDRLGSKDPWPVLVALEAWGLVWLARNGARAQAVLLLSALTVPILAALAVSFALAPVFLDRTLIWVALPGYLALAAGIAGLPGPRIRAAGAVLVLALFAWATATYHERKAKEPWREVARVIAAEWRPGDRIAVAPSYAAKPMGYYRRRQGGPDDVLVPRWEDPTEGLDRPEYERRLSAAGRVWLVTRTENSFDPRRYWVTRALEQQRPRLRRLAFDDRLGLELFGAPGRDGEER
jgi:uncharacterized membrane protein